MSSSTERKDLLLGAGLALSSEVSLPVILQRIVDLAAQLTDARYGALGVLGPTGEITDLITTGLSQMRSPGSPYTTLSPSAAPTRPRRT